MKNIRAIDVANFFVNLALQLEDDSMTNLKLNKLLYFAQGASFARFGEPLFSDDLEAWKYGPVAPEVYNVFKVCGRNQIEDVLDENYSDDIFPGDVYDLLLDVYREYGKFSASYLVELSHQQGGPWDHQQAGGIIPKEEMKAYFTMHPICQKTNKLNKRDFVGYRDADGFLVLPKEYKEDGE